MQKPRSYYGKRYRSNDAFGDWIFWRFIFILNEKVHKIVFRTPLRDPDKPRKRIFGAWMRDDHIIDYGNEKLIYEKSVLYIDPELHQKNDEAILSTLLHELAHILFADTLKEQSIKRIEKLLFNNLSPTQKQALARFLPKKNEGIDK